MIMNILEIEWSFYKWYSEKYDDDLIFKNQYNHQLETFFFNVTKEFQRVEIWLLPFISSYARMFSFKGWEILRQELFHFALMSVEN